MPHEQYVEWQRKSLAEMMRLLKGNGAIFYNHKWRVQRGLLQDRADIVNGFPVRQIIIWQERITLTASMKYFKERKNIMTQYEFHEYATLFPILEGEGLDALCADIEENGQINKIILYMKLRPYQTEAVQAVYDHLQSRDDNPCVVIPTGGGKTLILAQICSDAVLQWGGRVLILAHVKELLQQNADKLRRLAPDVNFGIYSAGLKSRRTKEPVIIAGIQSVYERACELGAFDLILIDESHLLPESGEGMYRTFMKEAKIVNPNVRLIGFTATPYAITRRGNRRPRRRLPRKLSRTSF
jgi:superfamily II DNA or RNA helicase